MKKGNGLSLLVVTLLLFTGLFALTGCQKSKTESLVVGRWEDVDFNTIVINVYESGEINMSGLIGDLLYKVSPNGRNLILYTRKGVYKTLAVEFPDDRHMVLTDENGEVDEYIRAERDSAGNPIITNGEVVNIPAVGDYEIGEVVKLGSDNYFVKGWFWADRHCNKFDAPQEGYEVFPVVEIYIQHNDFMRSVEISDVSFRDKNGLNVTSGVSTQYSSYDYDNHLWCAPSTENRSFVGSPTITGNGPEHIPFTEHYYVPAYPSTSYIPGTVKVASDVNWTQWEDTRVVFNLKHGEEVAIANYYLGDNPVNYDLPSEIAPISMLDSVDGVGPDWSVVVDSLVSKVDKDLIYYSFDLTVSNTSSEIIEIDDNFTIMDYFGSYNDGTFENGSFSLAPGESIKVTGNGYTSHYPESNDVVLFVFQGNRDDFNYLAVALNSEDTAESPVPTDAQPSDTSGSSQPVTPAIGPDGYVAPYAACQNARDSLIISGIDAVVSPGKANRMRSEPSLSGDILRLVEAGTRLQVLEGPACSDDMTWWKVSYKDDPSIVGWTSEGNLSGMWLLPLSKGSTTGVPDGLPYGVGYGY